jgi:hypothetical protein
LLIYRLLHFHDIIPDIKLNIKGREKQLFKPVLRIFQKTETLAELLPVISSYVIQKREANFSSLHAFLYRVIKDLIAERQTTQLESGFVWDYIKANLPGAEIPGKALSYDTSEFGTLSQKEVTQTLEHIFGAKPKKSHGITALVFETPKLKRLANVFDLSPTVKVVEGDQTGEDGEVGEDVGMGRYLEAGTDEHKEIPKMEISERESSAENGLTDPLDPPHVPHLPPDTEAVARLKEYERLSALARKASKEAANTGEV